MSCATLNELYDNGNSAIACMNRDELIILEIPRLKFTHSFEISGGKRKRPDTPRPMCERIIASDGSIHLEMLCDFTPTSDMQNDIARDDITQDYITQKIKQCKISTK